MNQFLFQFNDERCYECKLRGTLILCDICPRSFHYCHCQPPLSKNNLPEKFKCHYCASTDSDNDTSDEPDVLRCLEKDAQVCVVMCNDNCVSVEIVRFMTEVGAFLVTKRM